MRKSKKIEQAFFDSNPQRYFRNIIKFKSAKTLLIVFILVGFHSFAQNQTLWFRADKGVNNSISLPNSGTLVSEWFDQSTTDGAQNGVQATAHAGQTETQLPGLPTFYASSEKLINFNPVIDFSNDDLGDALGFQNPAGLDQTIFVVFKARGSGNGQYNQGLLYGGDISSPSTGEGGNRSDMSFGIASGNRLSFGGGFSGDYFNLGDFNLLGFPTIGVLSRDVISNNSVSYSMYANGTTDETNINALDITPSANGAGLQTASKVRIGKHFSAQADNNTAAELNGSVAEVIVFNGLLTELERRKVESYLAIKYGITLTGGTDNYGLQVGNDSYNYFDENNNVIWASNAQYKYDIAGIGTSTLWDLDQRISQSINPNTIVRMSSDVDFNSNNLNDSRTTIEQGDFLIWASDRDNNNNIQETSSELGGGVSSRIDREWKVQLSNTDGSDISSVNIQMDLSSITLSTLNVGQLKLLIDRDGNGNFGNGNIDVIPASLINNGKIEFHNVEFNTNDVFTLGITTDPCLIGDDTDLDGLSNFCDNDVDNDGVKNHDDGCGALNVFDELTEGQNLPNSTTYALSGTNLTLKTNNPSGFKAYDAEDHGEAVRMRNTSNGGFVEYKFSTPIKELDFKITDYDQDEAITVEIYLAGATSPMSLDDVDALEIGSLVHSRIGNHFPGSQETNIDGNSFSDDPLGTIQIFHTAPISKIKIISNYTHGGSLRLILRNYCALDTDGDGVLDYQDLDSDNDGIYDVVENNGTDANNDGKADDTDGNSSNNNGIPSTAGSGLSIVNTNTSTPANFLNLDSDADGCSDANEAYDDQNSDGGDGGQYGTGDPLLLSDSEVNVNGTVSGLIYQAPVNAEFTNNDFNASVCFSDPCTDASGVDTDGDGINDVCDHDADNDGVSNAYELMGGDPNCPNGLFQVLSDQLNIYFPSGEIYIPIGVPTGFNYNAMGFNENDGLFYAIVRGPGSDSEGTSVVNKDIITVNPFTGTTKKIGSLNTNISPISGDVYDGKLYVSDAVQGKLISYDLASNTINEIISAGFFANDFSIYNNVAYAVKDQTLSAVNLSTGAITTQTLATANGGYGASFIQNGNQFYTANNNGKLYRIEDFTSNSASAILIGTTQVTLANDGASCPQSLFGDVDSDNDGIPDYVDLDSDNDGIYDVVENNGTDANNDGKADDSDGNSSNNNGIPSTAGSGLTVVNTISATSPNFINIDSDNDGCSDVSEFYDNSSIDVNQDGTYGGLLTSTDVDAQGKVNASSYPIGTNLDYINASVQKSCGGPKFDCESEFYQVISGQLKKLDPISGNYTNIGTAHQKINALGFNPVDSFMYGIVAENEPDEFNVFRLYSDGTMDLLGVPENASGVKLDVGNFTQKAGDFDDQGFLWTRSFETGEINKIDVSQNPPSFELIPVSPSDGNVADIVFIDGDFYGVRDSFLFQFDISTNPVSLVKKIISLNPNSNNPLPNLPTAFGATYTDNEHNLYISANDGGVYRVNGFQNISNSNAVITADFLIASESTNQNDGASCPTACPPFDLDCDGCLNADDPNPMVADPDYDNDGIADPCDPVLLAVDDSVLNVNGFSGVDSVLFVFENDSLNRLVLDTSKVTLTVETTDPNGFIELNPNGYVDVNPNTPSGIYILEYTICSNEIESACDTAMVTVKVETSVIKAFNDSIQNVNGIDGLTNALNVFANDSLNNVLTDTSKVELTETTSNPNLVLNPNGSVDVNPNTSAGTYTLDYKICEKLNPTNCDDATVVVEVLAVPIVATNDSVENVNGIDGLTNALNVFANDSLNGALTDTSKVELTETTSNPNLVLNPNGSVDVKPNTPAGTYTLDYKICEKLNPTNCDDATVVVEVLAVPIVATNDSVENVNGIDGLTNALNVFANDSLNGALTDTSKVELTETTSNPNLVLNPNGSVDVKPNTPAGTYALDYKICEKLNPTNCDDATVVVEVLAVPIVATNDSVENVNGIDGLTNALNVFANDSLNGALTDTSKVELTETTSNPNLVLNPNGSVDVNPNTPAGTYTLNYKICEKLNPTNCEDATVVVEVLAAPIVATNDSVQNVNGIDGLTNAINVFANDSLNGSLTDSAKVELTETVSNPNLVLNPDGSVDVKPNTPAGVHTIDYKICEKLNPTNCEDASVVVEVLAAPIIATNDSIDAVNGLVGLIDALNVFANDSLNGSLIDPTKVELTETVSNPNLVLNPDGSVDVKPNTPAGTYTLDYKICEKLNPTNCIDATVVVEVLAAPLVATNDSVQNVNGIDGLTNAINVFANDSLNGSLTDSSKVELTETVSNPNLVLNPDGSVDVKPNTPAGVHTIDYKICEKLNPTNCEDATVVIEVLAAPIKATNDSIDAVNGLVGLIDAINVFANDSLNGGLLDPTKVELTETVSNPNLVLNPDGSLDVNPNTPAGTYTIDYKICEKLNPTNCDNATVVVEVDEAPIVAVNDTVSDILGSVGGSDLLNILDNDSINHTVLNPNDFTFTVTIPDPNNVVTVDTNGLVQVANQTPEGDYVLTYEICEKLNPSNCTTAQVVAQVTAQEIIAVNDVLINVNGTNGVTGGLNVLSNDTLGSALAITQTVVTSETVADPNGFISINTDGTIDVAPNTPAGTYQLTYKVCEALNPTNCDDAIATVHVVAAPIEASADQVDDINGFVGENDVINVLENDKLNGVLTDTSKVVVSTVTPHPSGLVTLNADGSVDVSPNTPMGNYPIEYQICEKLNPTNCATSIVSVTVGVPTIVALNDSVFAVNGADGLSNALHVFENDSLNSVLLDSALISFSVLNQTTNVTMNEHGDVQIAPNTPSGSYEITYQICENLNPNHCTIATVFVEVLASDIIANDDIVNDVNGFEGGNNLINVFDNDSLNGALVDFPNNTIAQIITQDTNGYFTTNGSGGINVLPNTPAGTYTGVYEICEVLNPGNCTQADVVVNVIAAPIVALNDSVSGVIGSTGQTGVLSVFDNDSLNGVIIDPSKVTLTETIPDPENRLKLNFDGSVDVNPNTPAGTYELTYSICEKINPTNCETAVVTVEVEAAPIVATDDSATGINGKDGATGILTVFDNDSLNGVAVIPSEVTLTETVSNPNLVLNADGSVDVNPNTPAGTYELTYSICENLNPTNCETAVVTVEVEAAPMVATDDSASGINGKDGATGVLTVFDNDSLNGVSVIPSEVTLTETIGNPNLVLNADGSVDVNPNTPAGTYELTYSICENLNPTNCETAVVTVEVEAAPIVATNDSATGINGKDGATGVLTVFDNDSLNGVSVIPSEVTLTETIGNPNLVLNADGSVDVNPNTPAGTYELTYSICENLNPTNCETAVVTVEVEAAPIVATDDSATGINGKDGETGVLTVFDNDSLNGVAVIPSEVTLTETVSNPNLVLNTDGSVDVNPNTPAGTYELTYSICENLNPTNCETAVVMVEVESAPIVASDDSASGINGKDGATGILTVFDNDSLNGVAVIPSEVTLTETIGNPNLVLNADGSVDVNPNTPAGTYELTYSICENLNPTNCEIAVVTVEVEAAPIVATDDSATGINGKDGATGVLTVFDNDSLNGVSVIPSEVTLTETVSNPNLVLMPMEV